MRSTYFILSMIGALLLAGCYKDFDNTKSTEFPPLPTVIFSTKMSGSFVDDEGLLQSGYTLDWGSAPIEIDDKHFIIDLPLINQLDNTIWANKNGERQGFIHTPMMPNDINHGELIKFSNWTQQNINNNSIISLFDKVVFSLDPTNFSSDQISYRTIDVANNILQHGYNTNGQLLSLSNTSVIDIQLPNTTIAGKIKVDLSSDYNLLKLDESTDKWIALDESEIGQSGYYAIAIAAPGVLIQGEVFKEESLMSYQWYTLDDRISRSTARGNWISTLPQNIDLTVDMLNPCLETINEQIITTTEINMNQNLDVGPEAVIQSIQTDMIDCEGNLVQGASVLAITESSSDETLYFLSDPEIDINIPVCDENFTVAAYDLATETTGLSIPWDTSIDDDISFLSTCESFADGYSIYKIRDSIKIYETFTLIEESNRLTLESMDKNMKLVLQGDTKGGYALEKVNIKIYDEEFGDKGYAVNCENSPQGCGIDDCYVSHLDESDQLVRVTFSGDIWMQTINPPTASTYRVEGMIICKPN